MKKLLALFLALALGTSMLAACGGTASSAPEASAAPAGEASSAAPAAESTAGGEAIKLTYLETQPTEDKTKLTQAMLDAFMAANPDITVELISTPNDQAMEKLMTMAAGGSLPDVIELNDTWLAPLASSGNLEALDSYMDASPLKDDIVDNAFKLGRVMDDTLYYIPYGLWGWAVYYNTAMLEATGLDVPVTQDDFYEVAKAMTDAGAGKYGYSFRGGIYGVPHALSWMLGELGTPDYFDENGVCVLDKPEAIEGLRKYSELYSVSPPDSTNWAFRECVTGFTTEVTGLLIQSNEVVAICNEELGEGKFDCTMLPLGSSGMTFDASGQTGYAMSGKSANKEAAWKLMEFFLDPANSHDFVVTMGFTPINKSLADDPAFSEGPGRIYMEQVMSDKYAFANNPSYLPEWGELMMNTGTTEIQKMFLGQQSVEATAKFLADYLTEAKANYDANNG